MAPGQEPFGSWGSIKSIVRYDKLFALLLALMAVNAALNVLSGAWFGAFVSGAVLWGLLTFRGWGYWLAMIGAGLSVLLCLLAFPVVGALGIGGAVLVLFSLAINGFVLAVLYTRRDRFD